MGATFNTGYLENLILYNGSNNIGIGTSADATHKVTLGGSLLGTSANFSGNVAIGGATLSAWGSGWTVLETIGGSLATNASGNLRLLQNNYFDGTNYIYETTAAATRFESSAGAFTFRVAPSGTAGTAATFSTALTIANTGAATFSSSVTIQGGNALYVNNAANTRAGSLATTGDGTELSSHNGSGEPLYLKAPHTTANIIFVTNGTNTTGERMRITSGGNVGIGTSSPQLNGNSGTFTTIYNASASGWLELATGSTTDGNGGIITFNNTNIVGTDKRNAAIAGIRDGANNSGAITFNTWNAGTAGERMRITSGGLVGIGTTNPLDNLHIAASEAGNVGISVQNTNASYSAQIRFLNSAGTEKAAVTYVQSNDSLVIANNSQNVMTITNAGKIYNSSPPSGDWGQLVFGNGNTNNSFGLKVIAGSSSSDEAFTVIDKNDSGIRFRVRGDGIIFAPPIYNNTTAVAANITIFGDGSMFRSTSSLKYKTDVIDYTKGLSEVMQLRPVSYKGKNDGDKVFAGLIAEEVHDLGLTEFVQYAEDDTPDALSYSHMIALLTNAIQEQQQQIEQLKAKLN